MSTTIRPNPSGIFPWAPRDEVFNLALGNGTQFRALVNVGSSGLFLAIEGYGAYTFATYPDPGYLASKLGLAKYLGDAANLADFVADQFDAGAPGRERFGEYSPGLCTAAEPKEVSS